MNTDLILNLARMARRVGVTARWLRAEADAGRIPCLRADHRFLFSPEAVERELALRAQGSIASGPEAAPRGETQ